VNSLSNIDNTRSHTGNRTSYEFEKRDHNFLVSKRCPPTLLQVLLVGESAGGDAELLSKEGFVAGLLLFIRRPHDNTLVIQ